MVGVTGPAEQLALPLGELVIPQHEQRASISDRFAAFHEANPWVADALAELARDWLAHGHTRVGIGMLFERVRWEYGRRTNGKEFKLNNDYRSRYARLLIERHPEWTDAFELRQLRSA